jgi:hypothetical protein
MGLQQHVLARQDGIARVDKARATTGWLVAMTQAENNANRLVNNVFKEENT